MRSTHSNEVALLECNMVGELHSNINYQFLLSAAKSYEKVYIICALSHWCALVNIGKIPKNLKFIRIPELHPTRKLSGYTAIFFQIICVVFFYFACFFSFKKLVLLSISSQAHMILSMLKLKLNIVLHSEFESCFPKIGEKGQTGFLHYSWWINRAITTRNSYLSLNPFGFQLVRDKFPFIKIYYAHHPYTINGLEIRSPKPHLDRKEITVAIAGGIRLEKGGGEIIRLINSFSALNNLRWLVLGGVDIRCGHIHNHNCSILSENGKYLNSRDYYSYLAESDIVLYGHPINGYRVSASGSVFDSILLGKLIISTKNPYIEKMLKMLNYSRCLLVESVIELNIGRIENALAYQQVELDTEKNHKVLGDGFRKGLSTFLKKSLI